MSKKKKIEDENTQYNNDIKKAEELLFYRKKEIIKYLNKKVPFIVFPMKYMKIEDISFTVAEFGKVFIHLYTTEDEIVITSKYGVAVHYDPPGLITVGPGLEYENTFIHKTKEVLEGYLQLLEALKEKYPNKNIYFGRNNQEYIERMCVLEKSFSLNLNK